MNHRYVFFGTPHIAALSLEQLKERDMLPELIVTAPARPQGRGMHIVETPVATFAREHDIPFITPEKITPEVIELLRAAGDWDFFLVVAYGSILPASLLEIVQGKVLNLHPSLLPLYRGPSPLESVLLSDDKETGVSIMELDSQVDHGPILTQATLPLMPDTDVEMLTEQSAKIGIDLLNDTIDQYLSGDRIPTPQDHDLATKTRKYTKADARLNDTVGQGLLDTPMTDWQKWKIFRAFGARGWVHFTTTRNNEPIAVKIVKASLVDDAFTIEEVIPTNGKRQSYKNFLDTAN